MRLLIVEDDFEIARNVSEYFEAGNDRIDWAPDGLIGLDSATREAYDVVILDIALPGLSGTELCARLRALGFNNLPIIMLTAKSELPDKVSAFAAGADDYVVKPFALQELKLRALALARRASDYSDAGTLAVCDLHYDLQKELITRAGKTLAVTPTGRKLLELLMRNSHRVVSKREIERFLWGATTPQSDALRIHIHALREAIDKPFDPPLLSTVRGIGYRLAPPDET